jgi:hypothetical protein
VYINMYLPAIDFVLSDLETRFHDTVMPVIGQMMTFSAGNLLNLCADVKAADVSELCNHYELDVDHVVRELNSFVPIFKANHMIVNMSDIARPASARSVTGGGGDDKSDHADSSAVISLWIHQTFLQPYRLLHGLSSFPALATLYKLLLTVSVTSASAERAMSKVKLVKTRLRSTMTDEYFSSLLLIASEKDLADKLSCDDIINRFASMSPVLRKHLVCA